MKKITLFITVIISVLWLWSCNKEEENLAVWNLQINCTVDQEDSIGNLVVCTAIANNANSFKWDLGIDTDTVPTAMVVKVRYPDTDTFYIVKCTATGLDNASEMTVTDTVRWNK